MSTLRTPADFEESLRNLRSTVYINGKKVDNLVTEPLLRPGINAIKLTYRYAQDPKYSQLMTVESQLTGGKINRLLSLHKTPEDVLKKLEMVRILCREAGCAQRYLVQDALNALAIVTHEIDAKNGTDYSSRFTRRLAEFQKKDISAAVCMTDAKGDRSKRPHEQADPDAYVRIAEKRSDGIIISGAKANITGAPYCEELIVLPTRNMVEADAQYAVACAVPADTPGIKIISRPAGRSFEDAPHSGVYGQSTALVVFDEVFVPLNRVFLAGEWEQAGSMTEAFANQHRQSCIGCRAGLGDMIIGATASISEYNGLDPLKVDHIREKLSELIRIVEGFYACGVTASVLAKRSSSGVYYPDPVYTNIGKLFLGLRIYDMFKIAHEIAGGGVVTVPSEAAEKSSETRHYIEKYLRARADVPADIRAKMFRFIEDITGSNIGGWFSLISLHGGGSPEAEKIEIIRKYNLEEKKSLARRLAGITD